MTKPEAVTPFSKEAIEAATQKAFVIERVVDITNGDHIALWLDHNKPLEGNLAWFACRIIEAHEIELAKAIQAAEQRGMERERERCAGIAERHFDSPEWSANFAIAAGAIAQAIRQGEQA